MEEQLLQAAVDNFKKILKADITHMEPLGGLSNYVYRMTDHQGRHFICKFLVSDKEDPFKKNERDCLPFIFEIYHPPIFESEHYRIEVCIPTPELEMEHFTSPLVSNLLQRSIARFNSVTSVKGQKPNLFKILDADGPRIMSTINTKMAGLPEADRTWFREQLGRVEALLGVLEAEYQFDELPLSHNDLFYRNLLFDEHKKRYHLIDFEYVGFNPKGMDIFQFVDEWLTEYTPEWPYLKLAMHNYPSQSRIQEMVRTYLYFYDNWREAEDQTDDQRLLDRMRSTPEYQAIPEQEVARIVGLFPYFGVITNAFWFIWALFVYKIEGIEFDYVHFGKLKLEMVEHFVRELNNPRATAAFHRAG